MDKKLADILWTARWAVNAEKKDAAHNEITKALIHIGAIKPTQSAEEPDRPNKPMPDDFMKGISEPKFVVVKGTKYNDFSYQTDGGKFEGLVVHYTVSGRTARSATAVVNYLAKEGLGCMVMDENGIIYIPEDFDIFKDAAHHAGTSKWGNRTSVSRYFAGMEICCWGRGSKEGPFREVKKDTANMIKGVYQEYTAEQEKALLNFILWARAKNPEFKIENVVGHDELRTAAGRHGDKQDPGASLSMTMPEFREFIQNAEKAIKS